MLTPEQAASKFANALPGAASSVERAEIVRHLPALLGCREAELIGQLRLAREARDDAMGEVERLKANAGQPDDQNTLRAIVSRYAGGLQAQLLELDIAVQGTDDDQLLAEFAHAITVSYEIAMAHGEAPFASIGEPPKAIRLIAVRIDTK